jgi:hypothetical protein
MHWQVVNIKQDSGHTVLEFASTYKIEEDGRQGRTYSLSSTIVALGRRKINLTA